MLCVRPRGFFAPHLFTVSTPTVVSRPCKRPALTLLLSANDRPFEVEVAGAGVFGVKAILVGAGRDRRLSADGCDLVSINIEPGHSSYNLLREKLNFAPVLVYNERYFTSLRNELRLVFDSNSGTAATRERIETLVEAAGSKLRCHRAPDQRIIDLLTHIHTALPQKVPLHDLARTIGLSADRLSHLFVDTVGTPLRSYIVWQRYKLALAQISQSAALTPLAYECGFSDAAHMTRVFVNFFGISPSVVMRSGFVQDFASSQWNDD